MTGPETPRIDLSAGIVPKKREAAAKIDLSAGLIAKVRIAQESTDQASRGTPLARPASAQAPPATPPAGGNAAGRMHFPPAMTLPTARQAAQKESPARQVEPPKMPAAAAMDREMVRSHSRTVSDSPSANSATSPVEPRAAGIPRIEEAAEPAVRPPLRGREPQPVAAPRSFPIAPVNYPHAPPTQSWERLPSRFDALEDAATLETTRQRGPEETANIAAARMSGLRNLIVTLGLKNMRPAGETEMPAFETQAPPVEDPRQRPAKTRTDTPNQSQQVPGRQNPEGASSTLVTAPPEFLPPRLRFEKADREDSASGRSTSRRDRRDTYDDVQILPSWRGQYKRKG